MAHLGTVKLGDNLSWLVNTHTPSTGAAVDADAVPAYRVYENEVETPLLTGNMAVFDDDDTVGCYSETIAVTTGNGFEVGKNYTIRVTGVVGGVTGVELFSFSIDSKRLADLNDAAAAPSADTIADAVHDEAIGTHAGYLSKVNALPANPAAIGSNMGTVTGVSGNVTGSVGSVAGNVTGSVGSVAGNVTGSVGSVAGNVTGSVASVTGAVTVGTNNDKTGYGLSTSERTTLTAAIWAALTSGLTTVGSIGKLLVDRLTTAIDAAVWTYSPRTLTSTAAATTAAVSGSTLTITSAVTYSATLSGLTIPADWLKVWLTIKASEAQADSTATLQIIESNPGVAADGLTVLNGVSTGLTAGNATLTVDQAGGTVTVLIKANTTDDLAAVSSLGYDLKCLSGTDTITLLTSGAAQIQATETKSIA